MWKNRVGLKSFSIRWVKPILQFDGKSPFSSNTTCHCREYGSWTLTWVFYRNTIGESYRILVVKSWKFQISPNCSHFASYEKYFAQHSTGIPGFPMIFKAFKKNQTSLQNPTLMRAIIVFLGMLWTPSEGCATGGPTRGPPIRRGSQPSQEKLLPPTFPHRLTGGWLACDFPVFGGWYKNHDVKTMMYKPVSFWHI